MGVGFVAAPPRTGFTSAVYLRQPCRQLSPARLGCMLHGYMGQTLWVDLSNASCTAEPLDETVARDFIGGYGMGARVLYDRLPPGIDALGPRNILGFLSGPMTGTPCI